MTQIEALWQYQEAELALDSLKKQVRSTPARQRCMKLHAILKEQTAQMDVLNDSLNEKAKTVEDAAGTLKTLLNDYDLEKENLEIMIKDEECTAAELTECREELEELSKRIETLRKLLAEVAESAEKTMTERNALCEKANKLNKEYKNLKAVCKTEEDAAAPEIAQAQKAVEIAAKQVSPEYLKKYKAVKKTRPQPLSRIKDNKCERCCMSLPTSVIRRVAASTSIVECDNCGRILCIL